MKSALLLLFLIITQIAIAQNDHETFTAHENLIGGIWKLDAKWGDGTPHKLNISYESSLDGLILKTTTHGNVKTDGYEFGLRNEGIRYFNKETKTIEFYEFDVFGGLTKGSITYNSKDIYYTYNYEVGGQKTEITDGWEYINENTYKYSIGIYDFESNTWKQKFLNAEIKRLKSE
ncbi:hypothetical protein [uncultured Psychroserpens sp.]|uniref:hypothetical protein n=1 Tax=uncultured Psychroserpens sp. TaxID=255436 RepID=UPI002603EE19|nr:hypothetical protein [uncultured Psychroserpens sp.]